MNSQHQHQPCEQYEGDLKAYLDNELPFSRRFQVRSHLANCPKCQEELNFMQTLRTELTAEGIPPLDVDLREKILQSAPIETPQPKPLPQKRKTSRMVFAYGGLALVGVIVMAPVVGIVGGGSDYAPAPPHSSALKSIGLGATQYTQDYDEPFGASAGAADSPGMRAQTGQDFQSNPVSVFGEHSKRAVHRQGSLTVVVDNAEAKGAAVENIVKNVGGYVSNNSLNTMAGDLRSASLDIRVPVDKFTIVVQKVGSLGVVRAKNITGEDVTAKLAVAGATQDTLSHQLAVAQARLRNLSKEFKPNSTEAWRGRQVVRDLSLRAAQAKAEQQAIQKFAALSTLYVTLQDQPKAVASPTMGGTLSATGAQAWASFLSSIKLPLQLLVWILAYLPLWLPALIFWRRFGRKMIMGS